MTTFPGSPRLLKGAIIGLDPANPQASVVVFQYNPDTMTRKLDARSTGGGDTSDRSEAFRLTGPPKETITLNIEVDAADELEQANPIAIASGVYPTLAALEMLLYPKSVTVIANAALALVGNIEIIPVEAPLTLFVWGPARVLPVRLNGLSITEEAYDTTAQSDPGQGGFDAERAELCRFEDHQPRLHAVPSLPDRQGGDGDNQCSRQPIQSGWVGQAYLRQTMFPVTSRYYGIETAKYENSATGERSSIYAAASCRSPLTVRSSPNTLSRKASGSTTSRPVILVIRSNSGGSAMPTTPCGPKTSRRRSAVACSIPFPQGGAI